MCLRLVGCEELVVISKVMTTISVVTKPFKSSIGLTKPFRQPTFIEGTIKGKSPRSGSSKKNPP